MQLTYRHTYRTCMCICVQLMPHAHAMMHTHMHMHVHMHVHESGARAASRKYSSCHKPHLALRARRMRSAAPSKPNPRLAPNMTNGARPAALPSEPYPLRASNMTNGARRAPRAPSEPYPLTASAEHDGRRAARAVRVRRAPSKTDGERFTILREAQVARTTRAVCRLRGDSAVVGRRGQAADVVAGSKLAVGRRRLCASVPKTAPAMAAQFVTA